MNECQKTAQQVLDYWISIEFLSQDSYEASTESQKCKKVFF